MTPSSCRRAWRKWRTPEYAAPLRPLLSMRGEEPMEEDLDPGSRLGEYVESMRSLVSK